ncbi:glycosyltransferase family 39 protein [Adhaeribacter rhizoryzae]|uniref:Glycosyltransferase family 39 protein n=1 Tax=Adhaeribacter rhizoryzae TaxID=2607907 RepID=A0A5M6DRB1_9BACT|nr:glycosyltransferase family 39 protein [Adhaeribacter rhizoryzae]KAA5548792.1 glycosyltransferase family 39 protein [Adhaeribacter rhizoryzae]
MQSKIYAWLGKWKYLVLIWLALGVGLRLFHFLDNRSLWVDEIYLASSLTRMSFWELTAPALDYEQKAPIGFLWLVRLCVVILGKHEMALRLVPLLAGIASLFLFVSVCRKLLKPVGVAVAVGILALAPPLVYHAVEIKQYSTELLATIIALHLYNQYHYRQHIKAALWWGCWGAVLIWFSYAAIFILAGMAGGMGIYYLSQKNWRALFRTVATGIIWLLSFALNYYLFTNEHANSEWLVIWFQNEGGFMPLPPTSLADLEWFGSTLYKMLFYPLGLLWQAPHLHNPILNFVARLPVLPLLFLGAGVLAFYKQNQKLLWVLLLPLFLTLLASGLKIYPFYERLVVFLAPLFVLFIAAGVTYLLSLLPARKTVLYSLPFLLFVIPLISSVNQVINPHLFGGYKKAYHREAFLYINEHFQPGDVVYIYWNAQHTYKFYKDFCNLKYSAIIGKDVRYQSGSTEEYFRKLEPDFDRLKKNKRVWVVYNKFYANKIGEIVGTPAYYYADLVDGVKLQHKFSGMGKELLTYNGLDVNVSLYELPAK